MIFGERHYVTYFAEGETEAQPWDLAQVASCPGRRARPTGAHSQAGKRWKSLCSLRGGWGSMHVGEGVTFTSLPARSPLGRSLGPRFCWKGNWHRGLALSLHAGQNCKISQINLKGLPRTQEKCHLLWEATPPASRPRAVPSWLGGFLHLTFLSVQGQPGVLAAGTSPPSSDPHPWCERCLSRVMTTGWWCLVPVAWARAPWCCAS